MFKSPFLLLVDPEKTSNPLLKVMEIPIKNSEIDWTTFFRTSNLKDVCGIKSKKQRQYLSIFRQSSSKVKVMKNRDMLPWCTGCSWPEMVAPAESGSRSPSNSTWRRHTPHQPPDEEADLETKNPRTRKYSVNLKSWYYIQTEINECLHTVTIHSPWILISRYPLTRLTRSGGGRSLLPSAAIVSCARTSSSSISFSITCLSFGENSVTSSRQAEKSSLAWAKSWDDRKQYYLFSVILTCQKMAPQHVKSNVRQHLPISNYQTFSFKLLNCNEDNVSYHEMHF